MSMVWSYGAVVLAVISVASATSRALPFACDSPIYCHGDLLHTVQMARIYEGSKSFVDLRQKHDVPTTLQNFDNLMINTNNKPSRNDVLNFLTENFEEGEELEPWSPTDYDVNPNFLNDIGDPVIQQFARDLVGIWPKLGKKVRPEVQENPDQYSLIYVDNGLIVPGGRFREFYYWDSYWIINGLLISGMCDTARGMIDNFLSMVDRFGFVPNGGRVYYLKRSQPPLLTMMARKYVDQSKDLYWLDQKIHLLAKELQFWQNRTIDIEQNGVTYSLAQYNAPSTGPRPESYREDYLTAQSMPEDLHEKLYINLKSAAESGWDFSSRWFFDEEGGNKGNLTSLEITRLIPVDLNAFLCGAFKDLSSLYALLGKTEESAYWRNQSYHMQDAIKNVLWNEEDQIWYDYDIKLKQHRKIFSASNVAPLWTECFDPSESADYGNKAVKYLNLHNATKYPGGIPTTMEHSGEQWDMPNCWPPLQAIVVQGLEKSKSLDAVMLGDELGRKWVHANWLGFNATKEMFEKYDAEKPGEYGGGGEYVVQLGFGWTNGAALEFINKYYRPTQEVNCKWPKFKRYP